MKVGRLIAINCFPTKCVESWHCKLNSSIFGRKWLFAITWACYQCMEIKECLLKKYLIGFSIVYNKFENIMIQSN